VKPRLGVVYHYKDEDGLWDAVRKEYHGPLVVGKDLMTIEVGKAVTWHEVPSVTNTFESHKTKLQKHRTSQN
jgi:hypothetical protein